MSELINRAVESVIASMPGFAAWVGNLSGEGAALFGIVLTAVIVITYNALRRRINGDEYEDFDPSWMDWEKWEATR